MRKDLSVLIAAAFVLCSCGNKTPNTTTPSQAILPDTKTEPAVTQTQEPEEKSLLLSYDGIDFYLEDADNVTPYGKNQSKVTYSGRAKGYISKGTYYDNFLNPELFGYTEKKKTDFLGEAVAAEQEWITDFTSDSYTVKTSCSFSVPDYDSDTDASYFPFFYNEIIISGDIILSGELYYFAEEQPYISAGDIKFKPDSSYMGLPYTDSSFLTYFSNEHLSNDNKRHTFDKVVYCDSPLLDLGNIHKDSGLYEMVSDIIGGGSSSVNVSAEIDFLEITMGYSDTMWCRTAVAESITAKE